MSKAIAEKQIVSLTAQQVGFDTPQNISGPCFITDEEGTVRAEGICCMEHANVMAAGTAMLAALKAIDAEGWDADTNGAIVIPSYVWDLITQAIDAAKGRQ